jgi:hypothetical protein
MDEQQSSQTEDELWAETRRLRLLRRRRLIATVALAGVFILLALSILKHAGAADSAHQKSSSAPAGAASRPSASPAIGPLLSAPVPRAMLP